MGTGNRVPRDSQHRAVAIGEAVDAAWHRAHSAGRLDVPLSVVAALALLRQHDSNGPDPAEQLRGLTTDDFFGLVRQVWTEVANARPDLVTALYPLIAWCFDEPDRQVRAAAHATATAAMKAGQLEVTGTDARHEVDVLGVVLALLKSRSAKGARGQFYTPAPLVEAAARFLTPDEGQTVSDPAVGTGGLFRAVAGALRATGRDPTTVTWAGCDVDELAVAAAAVNSLLWNLGPRVLLYAGDVLAEPDWIAHARAQRAEILHLTDTVRRDKQLLIALDRLTDPCEEVGQQPTE
ncbi:hypothetical protein FHX42_001147 [Saccharopolyspora lacisalsi]|uniref:DNA methylase adenine-specific domain-containing protein n=1 Tax=Halosaccharopolyspora lacisalsi TaxID=1000566 RepID=A0A839DYH9_9PSEU|nr:N-6 DNA methylase [Halosaccharopolyspora lacisalsi]MBA8823818.1 hypothetical protein [Halosaccharopolyspora lacisalsi]